MPLSQWSEVCDRVPPAMPELVGQALQKMAAKCKNIALPKLVELGFLSGSLQSFLSRTKLPVSAGQKSETSA